MIKGKLRFLVSGLCICLVLALSCTQVQSTYAQDAETDQNTAADQYTQDTDEDSTDSNLRAGLCVNEVCSDTDKNGKLLKVNTVEGGYYDWIELYNCSNANLWVGQHYIVTYKRFR